jgi:hypothetical protein
MISLAARSALTVSHTRRLSGHQNQPASAMISDVRAAIAGLVTTSEGRDDEFGVVSDVGQIPFAQHVPGVQPGAGHGRGERRQV